MAIKNGLIPSTLLVQLQGQPAGARLLADAAASWERMCDECEARFGWRPRVTSGGDAFRPYAVQERIFKQRYTATGPTSVDKRGKWWQGRMWYRLPIWAAAATPGTSNHGLGCACDITGLGGFTGKRYRQLASIAGKHGWDNNEGRSIAEAWHWVHKPHLDLVARTRGTVPNLNIPTPGGTLPGLLTPEDDMYELSDRARDDGMAWFIGQIKGQTDHIPRLLAAVHGVQSDVDKVEWGVLDESQGARAMLAAVQVGLSGLTGRAVDPTVPDIDLDDLAAKVADAIPDTLTDRVLDQLGRRLMNGA